MIIDIKKQINSLIGKKIKVYVDIGRNKNEIYEGIILNTYNNVWLLKTNSNIKSFSYIDVLINNVKIAV